MMQLLYKKRKLLGNKGFSLVELIIVIAIMAILVAILAPQYLSYVDKSRQSKDDSNADQLLKSVQVLMSDDATAQAVAALTADPKVTFSATGTVVTGDTDPTAGLVAAGLNTSLGVDSTGAGLWKTMEVTSTKYKNSTDHAIYTIDINYQTASVTGAWS